MSLPPPLSLEDAQTRLLALAQPQPIERIAIEEAAGRYLAEPLLARRTQPAADMSAMDGYAVMADALAGPWQVVGESAAGHPSPHVVGPGEAVRISTGALMPAGAGAVVLQEDVSRMGDTITLTGTPPFPAHKHIRRCGMDFADGAQLLPAGTRMGPAQVALGIAGGHTHVPVRHPVHIAILDSGDELAAPGQPCPDHRIPASNGAMLAAMVAGAVPAKIDRLGPVADTMDAMADALARARYAQVIVTSGGASVGDHDLVRPALEAWGAEIDFWRVAIKPGKPLLIARKDRQIVVGLPGNPASSLVTAHFFLLPLLRSMLGAANPLPFTATARLAGNLRAGGTRREFQRAIWDGATVNPAVQQDSGALGALAASNALIDIPAHAPPRGDGDEVTIFPLGFA
ncbi:MAG: molybdopterin molybdotransferase MoeA [Sphingomonadales bacterium]|nr:molybdopterin molybdotransferase MoeA [Sphingomonadales bacterium]